MRKWTALAQAGPARYRPSRAPSARALRTLVSSDLPEETRAKYLRRIYDLTTRDDVELLDELGLLVEHDPERSGHRPRGRSPRVLPSSSRARVAELSAAPKAGFFVDDAPRAGQRGRNERLKRLVRRG